MHRTATQVQLRSSQWLHGRKESACTYLHHSLLDPSKDSTPAFGAGDSGATCFQFQGEFIFFFEPFSGTWAKQHYENVYVHRFDQASQSHKPLGVYSLEGHYCNCVVGADRYLVISFWPYEEEAIRALHESRKHVLRLEKQLKSIETENSQHKKTIQKLNTELKKAQNAAQEAHTAVESERQQRRASEANLRQLRQTQEAAFSERLRLRDPIHIYALAGGDGSRKEDWTLVLDYHKGAHDITLGRAAADGSQRLEIMERQKTKLENSREVVFAFDLIVPCDLTHLKASLPLVPGKLCDDF